MNTLGIVLQSLQRKAEKHYKAEPGSLMFLISFEIRKAAIHVKGKLMENIDVSATQYTLIYAYLLEFIGQTHDSKGVVLESLVSKHNEARVLYTWNNEKLFKTIPYENTTLSASSGNAR